MAVTVLDQPVQGIVPGRPGRPAPVGRQSWGGRVAGHEPDGVAALPGKVHLTSEQPGLLQGDERLAHRVGTLTERVADLAPEALPGIGPQLAALVGDVIQNPATQGSGLDRVERPLRTIGVSLHTPCLPATPFGLTSELHKSQEGLTVSDRFN